MPGPNSAGPPDGANPPVAWRRFLVPCGVCLALVVLLVGGAVYVNLKLHQADGRVPREDEAPVPDVVVATDEPDERLRRLVVGAWEDDYQGKRTMTLQPDGTGRMIVELSGFSATLFAPRLQFNMTWAITGGRLQKKTTGGEPAATVQLILKTMGDSVDEPILELTDDRLLLLDKDGKTKYDWRRKKTSPK